MNWTTSHCRYNGKGYFVSKINLIEVTEQNIEAILALKVSEQQQHFVASPSKSLAYAYVKRADTNPYGIYWSKQLIGYVSIILDTEDNMYNIWHFLIDEAFQGRGLGKLALIETMAIIREKAQGITNQVALGVEPENTVAIHLYETVGFVDRGERDEDGEMIMTCWL